MPHQIHLEEPVGRFIALPAMPEQQEFVDLIRPSLMAW
jgi:hypothetical protein